MDRYTLMASKLTQLQEEWEPKDLDEVYNRKHGLAILVSKTRSIIRYSDGKLIFFFSTSLTKEQVKKQNIYKPILEDLIKMLEEKRWMLNWKLEHDHHNTEYPYGATDLNKSIGWFAGIVPKEALIKLVAYERWGLTWSDEKETWEEG